MGREYFLLYLFPRVGIELGSPDVEPFNAPSGNVFMSVTSLRFVNVPPVGGHRLTRRPGVICSVQKINHGLLARVRTHGSGVECEWLGAPCLP